MKWYSGLMVFLPCCLSVLRQATITGNVKDIKNNPIVGANMYPEGTYDGDSTASSVTSLSSTKMHNKPAIIMETPPIIRA